MSGEGIANAAASNADAGKTLSAVRERLAEEMVDDVEKEKEKEGNNEDEENKEEDEVDEKMPVPQVSKILKCLVTQMYEYLQFVQNVKNSPKLFPHGMMSKAESNAEYQYLIFTGESGAERGDHRGRGVDHHRDVGEQEGEGGPPEGAARLRVGQPGLLQLRQLGQEAQERRLDRQGDAQVLQGPLRLRHRLLHDGVGLQAKV